MPVLRIAIIVSPWFAVPPRTHGGIETLVGLLADRLQAAGHDVTLFTVGTSTARAKRHAHYDREQEEFLYGPSHSVIEANHVLHAYEEIGGGGYDIIHDNAGLVPAGVVGALLNERRSPRPILRTVHQAVTEDRRALYALLNGLPHVHFNAISDHQRRVLGGLKVVDTIHNAVDPDRYTYREDKQDYLAFLGRIIPEKGVHVAIDAADRAGLPLKIAGRIERTDAGREYFDVRVRPRLGRQIEYIGEVEHQQKDDLLSHARALIFPVQWAEPFGLVAIEALAAGTPVIASSHGALPEIIQHGRCGFLADEPTELDQAIQSLDTIRPGDCRERVRRCFGPDLMVGKYLDTYRTLLSR